MSGRTAVVTGAGTGIGRAIARGFAADGDVVVLTGRRAQVLSEAAEAIGSISPGRVIWRACDVTNPRQVDSFVAWFETEVAEPLDVLVNNAGGRAGYITGLAADATTDDAARYALDMLAANVVGPYLMVRTLLPLLRRPGGRIVNVSSIAAFRGGGDMYSAAKAGVVGLTYALARELGPDGVTVNVVSPGLVEGTEFFGPRGIADARRQGILAETPLGVSGTPGDIAAAVRYLASPEAGYVTGEVLHVNGGQVFGR